jgi:hypothetical protein
MTEPALSVDVHAPVADVIALVVSRRIRRVPVTQEGKLVGILSRHDLLPLLVEERRATNRTDDIGIRRAVATRLNEALGSPGNMTDVDVSDGIVRLRGWLATEAQRAAVRVAVESVDGVRGVVDQLGVRAPV